MKLIIFDLDMTLLDHKSGIIPESAIMAWNKLKENGHILAIATGRNMHNYYSAPFLELLQPMALIEQNGTRVSVGDKVIKETFFDRDILKRLLDYCIEKKYAIGFSNEDKDYYFNEDTVYAHDIKRWGICNRNFANPNVLYDMPIRTLAYIGDEVGIKDIQTQFPTLKLPLFAGMQGADVMPSNVSKVDGLYTLLRYYGISQKDSIAFGDSMNDIEIIKQAHIGIAMGNAIREIKECADIITDNIDEDGVFNACKTLMLL